MEPPPHTPTCGRIPESYTYYPFNCPNPSCAQHNSTEWEFLPRVPKTYDSAPIAPLVVDTPVRTSSVTCAGIFVTAVTIISMGIRINDYLADGVRPRCEECCWTEEVGVVSEFYWVPYGEDGGIRVPKGR